MISSSREGKLRVSCAGLCRIRDAGGLYLLGLNRDRLASGRRVYMPLGGALRYYDETVLSRFQGIPEAPGTGDLRLLLDEARIADFRAWFLRREGREISVFRELYEELVEEFRVLPQLSRAACQDHYAYTFEARRVSDRQGASGRLTCYFHDIFDVSFEARIQAALDALPANSGLRWFTEAEIRAGVAADGADLEGVALLGPE